MIYIGVVGQIASGKGILVNYLTSHFNFISFSLSSIVHEELRKKGMQKFTREDLQDMGDELRKQYGDAVLAKLAIKKLKVTSYKLQKKRIVIEGIRNPGEIEFLKKNTNFILIGVKATRALRFKRLVLRNKEWDPKNYSDFLKIDRRDIGVGQNKSGQQVGKCLNYCDYVLTNNNDIKEFEKKIRKLMKKIINS